MSEQTLKIDLKNRAVIQLCFILLNLFFLSACSTGSGKIDTSTPEDSNPRTFLSDDEKNQAKVAIGTTEFDDLTKVEKVRIRLAHAKIKINGDGEYETGSLSIKLLKGKKSCKTKVAVSQNRLTIVEASLNEIQSNDPEHAKNPAVKAPHCFYDIELTLPQPGALDLNVHKGNVTLLNWHEEAKIAMEWGDIDFESIENLSIECKECTVTGSGVEGILKYKVDRGNIGIEGLTQTVEGTTGGDTVLRWRKLTPGSHVSVFSKTGDIMLAVPERTQIALDLKVPRGEIYSSLKPHEVVINSQELKHGIPFSVTAETGSLRIVH